jgi:hypothetical protein
VKKTDAVKVELTADEADALAETIELAGDFAALVFGVDNAGGCLGKRGKAVAWRLVFAQMDKLEKAVDALDQANVPTRLENAARASRAAAYELAATTHRAVPK